MAYKLLLAAVVQYTVADLAASTSRLATTDLRAYGLGTILRQLRAGESAENRGGRA